MKRFLFGLAAVLSIAPPASADFDSAIEHYLSRYQTENYSQKITDNRGNGFEDLYGTRNMRMVLKGLLYRGGANNFYHRTAKRDNMNPLPQDGLSNLCREGFSKAVYLYSTRFSTAEPETACQERAGGENNLVYKNFIPLGRDGVKPIFALVHEQLMDYQGPIYIHCWNGWHASGYTAATALMQFCGFSGERAVEYWDLMTDGNNTDSGYERIRQRIREFTPFSEFQIPEPLQRKICPL